jgi:hypothetical protein
MASILILSWVVEIFSPDKDAAIVGVRIRDLDGAPRQRRYCLGDVGGERRGVQAHD